jgi:hypothetical protein
MPSLHGRVVGETLRARDGPPVGGPPRTPYRDAVYCRAIAIRYRSSGEIR